MKKLLSATAFLMALCFSPFALSLDEKVYVNVNGMVCDFCARALEKVFGRQESVESIKVDLDDRLVVIHLRKGEQLDDATITQLITDSGYAVREIKRGE